MNVSRRSRHCTICSIRSTRHGEDSEIRKGPESPAGDDPVPLLLKPGVLRRQAPQPLLFRSHPQCSQNNENRGQENPDEVGGEEDVQENASSESCDRKPKDAGLEEAQVHLSAGQGLEFFDVSVADKKRSLPEEVPELFPGLEKEQDPADGRNQHQGQKHEAHS